MRTLYDFFSTVPHPPGHHTSNVYVYKVEGEFRAHSKFFGPDEKGRMGSGDYHDVLDRTAVGWRIRERVAVPRHPPLRH
jgi:hypothetical protein